MIARYMEEVHAPAKCQMLRFDPVSLQTVFSTGVLHEGWMNRVYDSFDHERETSFPNSGALANDDRFVGVFAHELEHLGGYSPENAKAVTRKLLPDILFYDPRQPVRYPHNGRTLTDDVVDVFFSMLPTNRNVTDKVGPRSDLRRRVPVPRAAAQCAEPIIRKVIYAERKLAMMRGA